MKLFSKTIKESKYPGISIGAEEFKKYKEAIEKTNRSKDFLKAMWIISQYPELLENDKLKNLLNGKHTDIVTVPENIIKDLQKISKKIGDEAKLFPEFLTAAQRDAVIQKKIDPNDLTLDLESQKGRDAIVKRYAPLIEKLVYEFYKTGCPLSKEELRSAALLGLTDAMNTYKNPAELAKMSGEGKTKNTSFTSYAAYKIKFQILGDIEDYGRTVKFSNYRRDQFRKENGEEANLPKEFSIDSFNAFNRDGEPIPFDVFFGLDVAGDNDIESSVDRKLKKDMYDKIFKRMESKFSSRDCTIFYKTWGLNGYKREKTKDVAKDTGISSPAVTQICNRIVKFLATDSYIQSLKNAFESIVNDYVIGKMAEIYDQPKYAIIESFVYDDTYVLLEELSKWKDKTKFQKAINTATDMLAVDDALLIYDILQKKKTFKKGSRNTAPIIHFLEAVYPYRSFKKASYEELNDALKELSDIAAGFNIIW